MIIEAKAVRGSDVRDRARTVKLIAETEDDERALAALHRLNIVGTVTEAGLMPPEVPEESDLVLTAMRAYMPVVDIDV